METLSLSVKKKKKKIESLKKKNKTKHNSHSSQNGIPQGPQWELVEDISTLPKAREKCEWPSPIGGRLNLIGWDEVSGFPRLTKDNDEIWNTTVIR